MLIPPHDSAFLKRILFAVSVNYVGQTKFYLLKIIIDHYFENQLLSYNVVMCWGVWPVLWPLLLGSSIWGKLQLQSRSTSSAANNNLHGYCLVSLGLSLPICKRSALNEMISGVLSNSNIFELKFNLKKKTKLTSKQVKIISFSFNSSGTRKHLVFRATSLG